MTILQYVLSVVLIILAIIIIGLVLLQESKQKGLSGTISGAADTFFGKNKGRTREAQYVLFTKIAGTLFFLLSFASALLILFGA